MISDDEVLAMMEANMAGHLAHLPGQLDGAFVWDEADLLVVDSGIPSDTFNAICRARLDSSTVDRRIEQVIGHFRKRGLPFSWWVGPTSMPPDLGQRLAGHGLQLAETEVAMSLDLSRIAGPAAAPSGLEVRSVVSEEDLVEHAAVVAANWEPPDRAVIEVYSRAASGTLGSDSPARYHTGYVAGEPVAASECYLEHGVAGIYGVVTRSRARRQGFGTALTAAALRTARREGYRIAVLQASAGGEQIYSRLGFTACGAFQEYKPR